jgi:chemotaxis protein histidine kinase CheA
VPDFRKSATTELSGLLDRLTAAAEAAAHAARDQAAAEAQVTIDKLTASIDSVSAERAALERTLREQADARQALEHALAEQSEARQAVEHAQSALEAEHVELQRRAAALESDRTGLLKRADTLTGLVDTVRAESAETRRDLQSKLDAALHDAADAAARTRDLQAKLDAALRDAAEASARAADVAARSAETSARAAEAQAEHNRALREQATGFVSRTLDRMLAVTTAFTEVTTEDEVLATVVEALATEFSRVALFKAALNRLDVVRHVGFAFPADPTHLVIPQVIDAVLGRAVTSGQIEMLSAEAMSAAAGTPFGGTPACALALPIDLAGDVCAVLYADDSDLPNQAFAQTELRRTFALLLRQLATPLLQRLPAEMKAVGELREYAAHLVAELENMYAADVNAHRKGQELMRRLQDNLECARGIYAQRVSSETPAAAALLEEELALAASAAHATPFGRDLMALLGVAESRVAEA